MKPKSHRLPPILAAMLLLLQGPPLQGMTVLPLDLASMTRQSQKIFVGRCLRRETDLDEYGIPATFVRFHIVQGLKGVTTGEEILVKQFGVSERPLYVREGEKALVPLRSLSAPGKSYVVGREYLLFFYPESAWGYTSPVGGGQGRFEIQSVNPPMIEEVKDEIGKEGGS